MSDEFDQQQTGTLSQAEKQKPISLENPFRLAIVGHGFVGKAVEYAFTHPLVDLHVADPKYDTTVDDLLEVNPQCVFICAPTPMNPETGFVDASIVEDAVLKLIEHTDALVVIKSTITPDVVDRLYNSMFEDGIDRFVYNPEFLTEKNAEEQFVNAEYHVIGGTERATSELIEIYDVFSLCKSNEYFRMSACEASFVKYGVNTFLATKVTFFNQLFDLVNAYQCSYNIVSRAIGRDPRIGIGHTRVPGYDRKRGFGGACFPKDIQAFLKFSEERKDDGTLVCFDLLRDVININNNYRKMYEVDDREKVNNISFEPIGDAEKLPFEIKSVKIVDEAELAQLVEDGEIVNESNGQTEEEQQSKNDGNSVGE